MKAIADTLGVSRSNLIECASRAPKRRLYHKPEDAVLLPLLRRLVDERPTYGYRRLTALLNRQLRTDGKPTVNGKRVLRILQVNGLTLERHTGERVGRTHDGVVVALRSNVRWCSDHLELHCRDGSIVRVLFAIDACDREIIAWSATTSGVSGEMVRDLMIACVERRFGSTRTPHLVEWLSDNGSAYIAKETRQIATALGLRLAFTPVRSPESNGISEAFVKTLKRDYARISILNDAATTMALLPGWFEDYNTVHPHSGLRFLSPREFRSLSA
jgi:putative transposase